MLTFLAALFGFLFARCLWDGIRRRAAACGQTPLAWMFDVLGLTVKLILVIGLPIAGLLVGLAIALGRR